MKIIFLLTTLFISCAGIAATETEEAKKSLRALIGPILQKEVKDAKALLKDFSVEKCEKYKINWMNIILMRKEAALIYTFKPGCDIEGSINPTVLKPFPVDLKLKNLDHFNRLRSENKITASLEAEPILNMAVRSATLTGAKGVVKFEADYAVKINPLKQNREMISENIGGEIRISEIYGKKASIKEKIKVD